jgi:hypothetical protein
MMRDMGEVLRDEMVMRDKIAALLREEDMTVPELAEALGYPAYEVMCWVMGMRRYGKVEETGRPDEDGYFKYTLADGKES